MSIPPRRFWDILQSMLLRATVHLPMERPPRDGGRQYSEASRRVREAFARSVLYDVLYWAFGGLEDASDDELDSIRYGLEDRLSTLEPAWAPVADAIRGMPIDTLRAQLRAAHETIRGVAHAVASREPTRLVPITAQIGLDDDWYDRDGRPRWFLRGDLADALVWMTLKLFSEVPRSVIRSCGITGCTRIYVAGRNQRYCHDHQIEAARKAQRRAEGAWRARQRAKKKEGRR